MALTNQHSSEDFPPEALRALELQSLGNMKDAEAAFRHAMDMYPSDARLRYALGAMLIQGKRFGEAEEVLREAVTVLPTHAESWNALGVVLTCLQRVSEALACFAQAVKIRPDFPEALTGIGDAMIFQEKWRDAELRFVAALAIRPDYTRARHGLALALFKMKRHNASLAITEEMLRHTPYDPVAQRLAHNTLLELRDHARAAQLFNDIVLRCPQSGSAWLALGNCLTLLGKYDEAQAACYKCLEFLPHDSVAHLTMGMSLLGSGTFAQADEHLKKCQECAQENLRELDSLLSAFISRWLDGSAASLCRRILALDAGSRWAKTRLIIALELLGREQEAVPLRKAVMDRFERDVYELLICTATMHQSESPATLLDHARAYGQSVQSKNANELARGLTCSIPDTGERRIRVGFVSHEVRAHSVSAFLEPVITHVNRDEFEVYLYSTDPAVDDVSKRLMAGADFFADLSALTPLEQAAYIRKDNIDIAIDTTGYTEGCHLEIFAQRVAPIQAHYIGYFGTSGLDRMDYFIGDRILNRPEDDRFFTEKIWRLPCFWTAWQERFTVPATKWYPTADGGITLGSCNALYKLGLHCLDLWGEIMLRLPGARLLLKNKQCADPALRAHIQETLARKGIDSNRIVFMVASPNWREHMAVYDQIDLTLDPMPFNGCTTAFEALWMGVPMIALEGKWMGGRVGIAMLRALGHPEWVAESDEEYITKAVALAKNVDLRRTLRLEQREKMRASPLCDSGGVARALEDAFRHMCGQA